MEQKTFYLTFDGAVNPPNTLRIMEELDKQAVQATFFVEGHRIAGHEEILRQMAAAGHHIGNHSFTHPDFSTLSPEACMEEVLRTDRALADVLGFHTPLLRPPCGILPETHRRNFERAGYQIILWSISVKDWLGPDAAAVAARTLEFACADTVTAVYHDHVEWTPEVVSHIIPALQDMGYSILPIPYESVPG